MRTDKYYSMEISKVIRLFESSAEQGLSHKQAESRFKEFGANTLREKGKESIIKRFFAQFSDFMILILMAAAVISFGISFYEGSADYIDPLIILAIIFLNAILGVGQESKAEHALEALKKLTAPMSKVIRGGKTETVPSEQLVRGDIVILENGNFVPADIRLIESVQLKTDEASLTGESLPLSKEAAVIIDEKAVLADRKNMVYSGTMITHGRGRGIVTATGMDTEVGRIAGMILDDVAPVTPLQKRLAKTGKLLGISALIICLLIFIIGLLQKRPVFDMFMTSVSLAVAAIPEGLPAIVTIMLSFGVRRLAGKNAIVRKLPAVETLGCATYICSDKTGTLTKNKMTAVEMAYLGERAEKKLLEIVSLCNDAQIIKEEGKIRYSGEPTETALIELAFKNGTDKSILEKEYPRKDEIPFDSSRKMMSTLHSYNGKRFLFVKGAPDRILKKCDYYLDGNSELRMNAEVRRRAEGLNTELAGKALRVIAAAFKEINGQGGLKASDEEGLVFVGLVGMIDPPRDGVKEAVATCRAAGITPVMITGDHAVTACAIANKIGILNKGDDCVTGDELNSMSDKELEGRIRRIKVFARVSPEHKVRIVKALQSRKEVVAMTGDGVNDAPALKAADIGCAMGKMGTDVAKGAADFVLADDNFSTIVEAVREGRGIYSNIRKAVHFLLSSNIGEILTILFSMLLRLPTPLLAIQLLWVNLVTDSLPAIALGVEPPDKDIMKQKPISAEKSIFADGLAAKIFFEGIMIGALAIIAGMTGGRTMAFCVLSMSQLFHAFNVRSDRSLFSIGLFSNPKLCLAFLAGIVLQVATVCMPVMSEIFKTEEMTLYEWGTTFLLSAVPIIISELQKLCVGFSGKK